MAALDSCFPALVPNKCYSIGYMAGRGKWSSLFATDDQKLFCTTQTSVACTTNILQLKITPLELSVSDATIWSVTQES